MSKIGTADITSIMLGSTEIVKAYLGTDVVYEKNTPLPYDAEIEYLQSAGRTWINTEFKPNQNTTIKITAAPNRNGSVRFFEVRDSGWNKEIALINFVDSHGLQARWGNKSSGTTVRKSLTVGTFYVLQISKDGVYVDGVKVSSLTQYTFQCSYNLALFANSSGGSISSGSDEYSKISACSIYDNGTLIRDYIAVRKGTVGYMYDKVSKQLIGSGGTGSFILGNDIT